MGQFMNPEDGNLHRPPKRWQNDNMKKMQAFGRIPTWPVWAYRLSKTCMFDTLIHSDGTWKEMNAKGKEHERNMKGNECKMKGTWKEHERNMKGTWKEHERNMKGKNDMCWLSTKDAFTPTAGKFTCLVQRAHHLRKRWACLKIDNMISGHFKWHRFLIRSHMHIQSYS